MSEKALGLVRSKVRLLQKRNDKSSAILQFEGGLEITLHKMPELGKYQSPNT
jgi:hypothetical protein